jgi:hypothetical protein
VCAEHDVEFEDAPCVGDEMNVPPDYFSTAYCTIFEIGVKLAHVLWRKQMPKQRQRADENLLQVGFDLLQEEHHRTAKKILDFSVETLPQYSNERFRRTFVINRAIAYKHGGEQTKAENILADEDWSATSNDFQLAASVLRENFQEAARLMRRIGHKSDKMTAKAYREWPLFKKFRETEYFKCTFKDVFDEPLGKIENGEKSRRNG